MRSSKNIDQISEYLIDVEDQKKTNGFEFEAKIHPWTTFCEGIADIEEGFKYYNRLYRRNYAKLLPEDKKSEILVLSAGVGYFVYFLNQMGFMNVIGVDSDLSKVKYAQNKKFNIIHGNAFDFLESTEKRFDLIVAEQEINHLTKNELVVFLNRARKCILNGGRLILNSTNYANPLTAIDHFAHNFNHFAGYTENSIEQVFEYCGFKDIACYPVDNYVFYLNPLIWVAKAVTGLFSLFFMLTYKMYGKSGKLFTKRIIGVGVVNKKTIDSDAPKKN
jgi:2-polyprenyl-3-methyl-5-hydroxy-6-metoxy-1,4-benzoquinol methylase